MAAIIALCGCSSSDKNLSKEGKQDSFQKTDPNTGEKVEEDKAITIHINNTTYNLKVDKYEAKRYKGIEKVATSFIKRHKELDSLNTQYVDFTGDGKPEKVEAHICRHKGRFVVIHYIYLNDRVIYSDTLTVYDDHSHNDRFEYYDSVNKKLEPYSTFYDGFDMISLDDNQKAAEFIDNGVTLGMRQGLLEKQNLSDEEVEKQMETFKGYLRTFKGKLLTNQTEDAGVWMWYGPEKQFIDLYEP